MKKTILLLAALTAFVPSFCAAQQSASVKAPLLSQQPANPALEGATNINSVAAANEVAQIIPEQGITIFMIGNSTMADKPYAVKDGGNPEKGWGQVFPLYFKEGVKVENHAMNGRSTKSFITEGRWNTVLDALRPGDYVIMEFGHNDQKKEDSTRYAAAKTDYRDNLLKFISETRSKGGIPVLATPIMRRRFDEKGGFYDTHGDYPGVVRKLAAQEQVPLLDLHLETRALLERFGEKASNALYLHIAPFEYASLPRGRSDDTHLSAYGAFKVCDLAVLEIRRLMPELAAFLKP